MEVLKPTGLIFFFSWGMLEAALMNNAEGLCYTHRTFQRLFERLAEFQKHWLKSFQASAIISKSNANIWST